MKKIFAANWKLNKTPEQAREFIIQFKNEVFKKTDFFKTREVFIFPSAFSLEALSQLCSGTEIKFGPQNIYSENKGAFTGENSAEVAKTLGSSLTLIGHSERRQYFKEDNSFLGKKVKLTQDLGLRAVYCIGETLEQREAGKTLDVCFEQLQDGLSLADKNQNIVVAYEPVWAIGTGKVATTAQVAEVHLALFKKMTELGFKSFQLLYGGSVKPDNAKELLAVPHVDGFLIGGAGLEVASFLAIATS